MICELDFSLLALMDPPVSDGFSGERKGNETHKNTTNTVTFQKHLKGALTDCPSRLKKQVHFLFLSFSIKLNIDQGLNKLQQAENTMWVILTSRGFQCWAEDMVEEWCYFYLNDAMHRAVPNCLDQGQLISLALSLSCHVQVQKEKWVKGHSSSG